MVVLTKSAVDVFAPTDGNGVPRKVDNEDAQTWGVEIERSIANGIIGTSTTSLAIGTGSKTWTVNEPNRAWSVGQRLRAVSDANVANWMEGLVTAYANDALVLDVDAVGGSGTKADWTINVAGEPGPQGPQGDTGATGPAGSDATVTTAAVDAAGATMNTDTDVSANSWVLDEDDMASDSATKLPTQQSVKAFASNLANSTFLQSGTGAVSRTALAKLKDIYVTPEDFGAVGDGSTDDSTAIQNAINTGRPVRLIASTYAIGTGLTIGDGTSSALSSQNGIVIEGSTQGASAVEMSPAVFPTRLKWIGSSGGTMLTISGPMVGCNLRGVVLDCNSLANSAVKSHHMVASTWVDVLAVNYKGTAFIWEAYAAFTGLAVGANKNTFINVRAMSPASGGSGARIGVTSGFTSGMLDVAQNTFINCLFSRDGTLTTTTSLYLAFCDNLTFIECENRASGGTSGVGVFVKPPSGDTGNTKFPQEILFLNCPQLSGITVDASWTPVSGIVCYPYPTADGESLPSSSFVTGADFNQRFFGNWSLALRSSMNPSNNGDFVIQKTSDTSLTFKVKGSDGTIRSASLTLA